MVTTALVVAENGPDLVLNHAKQSMLRKLKKKTQSQLMMSQDLALFNEDTPNCRQITVEVQCGGNSLEMEIDTRAAVSIISQSEYQSKLSQFPLHDSYVVLKT